MHEEKVKLNKVNNTIRNKRTTTNRITITNTNLRTQNTTINIIRSIIL